MVPFTLLLLLFLPYTPSAVSSCDVQVLSFSVTLICTSCPLHLTCIPFSCRIPWLSLSDMSLCSCGHNKAPQSAGLKQLIFIAHSPGSLKSKINEVAGLVSAEASVLDFLLCPHVGFSLCPRPWCPSACHIPLLVSGWIPLRGSYFNLTTHLKALSPNMVPF